MITFQNLYENGKGNNDPAFTIVLLIILIVGLIGIIVCAGGCFTLTDAYDKLKEKIKIRKSEKK